MQRKRWFLRIAGGFVALVILLALASAVLVSMRQGAMKPLDREELARLGIVVSDRNVPAAPAVESVLSRPADPAAADEMTSATTHGGPDTQRAATPRLARAATEEDWKLSHSWSEEPPDLKDEVLARVGLRGMKWWESALWLTGSGREGLAFQIGLVALYLGDRTAARQYLQESLSEPLAEDFRAGVCGQLAWVEDDPEVATALLERSCADMDGRGLFPPDAINLAIVTHSDALAESYFQRWSEAAGPEKTAEWLAWKPKVGSVHPEIEAWKKRHSKSP